MKLKNNQCGVCVNCVPQINGGSGFNNCDEAHAAQLAEDNAFFTKEQLTNYIKATIAALTAMIERGAISEARSQLALLELKTAEIALAALTAKPFMYGIEDCDGMAYFAEHCVSSNPAHLSDELHASDDESGEGAKVIPLYKLPMVEGIK